MFDAGNTAWWGDIPARIPSKGFQRSFKIIHQNLKKAKKKKKTDHTFYNKKKLQTR